MGGERAEQPEPDVSDEFIHLSQGDFSLALLPTFEWIVFYSVPSVESRLIILTPPPPSSLGSVLKHKKRNCRGLNLFYRLGECFWKSQDQYSTGFLPFTSFLPVFPAPSLPFSLSCPTLGDLCHMHLISLFISLGEGNNHKCWMIAFQDFTSNSFQGVLKVPKCIWLPFPVSTFTCNMVLNVGL